MKRHSSAASLALAVLAVLGLAGPAAAGDQVPFNGRLEGDVTNIPLAPPFASVLVEGTGKATHLGRFTVEIPHVVDRSDGTGVGSFTFTAANGDTLTADFTGQAMPTATPGVLYIVGDRDHHGRHGPVRRRHRELRRRAPVRHRRRHDHRPFDGTISNRRGR